MFGKKSRDERTKKGKFSINIQEVDLDPVFEEFEKKDITTYEEAKKICDFSGVNLRKLQNEYIYNDIYNNSKAVGVIKSKHFAGEDIILFNNFFIWRKNGVLESKYFLIKYNEIKDKNSLINTNKYEGKHLFLNLSRKEREKLKSLIEESKKISVLSGKNNVKEFVIKYYKHELGPVFRKLDVKNVTSYNKAKEILFELNYDILLKKPPLEFTYNNSKALGMIESKNYEDSLIIFNNFFIWKPKKNNKYYKINYEEIEGVNAFTTDNKFRGRKKVIHFSGEEENKIKALVKESQNKLEKLMQDEKTFKVNYLGGVPDCEKGKLKICASEEGVIGFKVKRKKHFRKFLLEWDNIENVSHDTIRKGDSSTKTSATTAGLLTGNNLLLTAGLFSSGEKTKELLNITTKDNSGYNSNVLFESKNAQEIKLYLDETRKKFYKPNESNKNQSDNNISYIEEIKELAKLKKEGIITEKEFNKKKKQLLDNE